MQPYPKRRVRCEKCEKTQFYSVRDGQGRLIKPEPLPPECCGAPMAEYLYESQGPFLVDDIKPFASPIDGKPVSSRSQRREMIKKHNLIEVGNEKVDMKPRIDEKRESESRKKAIADAIEMSKHKR